MKKAWKWIILGFIAAVLIVFTIVAWVDGKVAGWIMTSADILIVGFIIYKWVKSINIFYSKEKKS